MPTMLETILAHTAQQVATSKGVVNRADLERLAGQHTPRGFAAALRTAAASRPAVIAELKKASPSRGLIREAFDPAALASALERAGAATLSVLTNERFFQGSLEFLRAASASVRIPCLRKDFMVDPFQVLEARAAGADAILLIAAALTDRQLTVLAEAARELKLDVLCEVHDREELERAKGVGCELIGVNSRNLATFVLHPTIQLDLVEHIPATAIRVAESGIRTAADIEQLRAAGYDAFLVGEALMRQPDPAAALSLLLRGEQPTAA